MANRLIGVISDTHGLLRPEAVRALAGVELIIHAGDIDEPAVLDGLRQIAPVVAVRGNVDHGPWARVLPMTEVVQFDEQFLYVLHDLGRLNLDPAAAGFHVVISGHTHKPENRTEAGILFLNPGSAGPKRFKLPVTLAIMKIDEGKVTARHVDLVGG
ncbi:MAG: metallophosphatase family protein [Lentisphaerae bacterium]|nr:metallophosphatase family protein [Lentisphaerota bacterium]